jgi:hypothetical protein
MLLERMIRAARLDPDLYNEVEKDSTATGQAFAVVLIVAICGFVGAALAGQRSQGIIGAGAGAVFGWLLWSLIILGVGKLLGGTADFGEVMRTLAFAYSPSALQVLVFIPLLGPLVAFAAGIWTIVSTVVAVREAMDFDTGRAVLTVLIPLAIVIGLAVMAAIALGVAIFATARHMGG